MKILITGAAGFFGKNLTTTLLFQGEHEIFQADVDTPEALLKAYCGDCDFVIHLAGVNRPKEQEEFLFGNRDALTKVLSYLEEAKNPVPVVLSSSIQAALENPYGKSKLAGEEVLRAYGEKHNVPVYIFRFPNLFGKWSKPNYNSAVATFCHNVARGLPITVNDPAAPLTLLYIDHAVSAVLSCLDGTVEVEEGFAIASGAIQTTVGQVADIISAFPGERNRADVCNVGDPLVNQLYATYLSFLPPEDFARPLIRHADHRGSFTELLHSPDRGQVSINVSKPGITKGNHWHHTKNEKFIVVSGEGLIRFVSALGGPIYEYRVSGEDPQVVDIPTGYSHSIVNVGTTDLVTVMWANECFDPSRPDTIPMEVKDYGN